MRFREEKVFKDPVHKTIYVQEKLIWDLINTSEFQRLRRIRQLGTSYLTFHGAEHSRFSHSLGVYEITRKIISRFERNDYGEWPEELRLLSLCAALLHDIGHGPFSHSMEAVFGIHHEDWTCKLITGDTGIRRVLSTISADFPSELEAVIRRTSPHHIVTHLISSQLDADRMDYLLRDAYFTGVNYGMFDLERILRVMRPHNGRIVVKDSGMHTVEDYLMSRYQMHWQVYFHPVTRSSEILLRKIFKRAHSLYEQGYRFQFLHYPLPRLFAGNLSLEDFLKMDEPFIHFTLMQWRDEKDEVLADLADRFINRRLFKYVSLDQIEAEHVEMLRSQLSKNGFDPSYYLEIDSPVDMPYDMYEPNGDQYSDAILLLSEQGDLVDISEKSEVIRSISGGRKGGAYLYFPQEVRSILTL